MSGNLENRHLKTEIAEKLQDEVLRGALGRFAEAYPIARAKAYENVPDIDALRDEVRCTKQRVVKNLDAVADRFEESAKARGAKVFRAADGDALKKYLLDLCKEKGVKRIVKSKSMASEEIHLNDALLAAGLHVAETDLGEWIISLAGQRPSHMVMPAIHLNRQQIAEYFSKELQEDIPSDDIPFMVQAARQHLREEFLQADMGITGANFGVAENAAIGLVTNEGNARLVSTLPRIQVVIIGYEKLVETLEDAAPILRTLPRNATGQLLTSYATIMAGVVPTMVEKNGEWVEQDKELHIILIDNGRLNAAKDERLHEVYQCVRCASCLNVCPIYTMVGGHVYGHIYAGGIGAILTSFLHGMKEFGAINELCIGCRRCTEICPGKIDIPGLIDELRARMVKENGLPVGAKLFMDNVLANRTIFHSLLRMASWGQKPFQEGRLIRHLPLFFAGLTKDRSLPAIAPKPLRDMAEEWRPPVGKAKAKVAFFSGCNIDFVFPEIGESAYKVLRHLNYDVVFPKEQSCCGKPILGMGERDTAKRMAQANIKAFEETGAEYIVTACPTCAETLIHTYHELFHDVPEWSARVDAFAAKVREFTAFVAKDWANLKRRVSGGKGEKVTYHDSCHLRRGLEITEEPRDILDKSGYDRVEMKNCDKCCGMAGAFGVKYVELSMPLLKDKVNNIINTGADIAAVACPACKIQIQGGLDKAAPKIKVRHIAELMAEKLEEK